MRAVTEWTWWVLSEVTKLAREGNADAFGSLVEPLLPGLYHTAAFILLDRELAKDAVQEALTRAFSSIRRFRGEDIRPWLRRIVLNEAKRLYRGRWRHAGLIVEMTALAAQTNGQDGWLTAAVERLDIARALAGLSVAQRTVIVLRYLEGLSEAEVATVLGVRLGTVKSRLYSARRAMQHEMGGYSHDGRTQDLGKPTGHEGNARGARRPTAEPDSRCSD